MAPKIKLYMFTGSAPSLSAQLMLEHKGLGYKRLPVMVGPHAFGMLIRGFQTMTVPALKIDGRRVQGSREIARELDELAPQAPLFPADPPARLAVAEAERFGEELQDAVRRIFWCAARRDRQALASVLRPTNPLLRMVQRGLRPLVTRLATAGHRATDRAAEEDLAGLPARLDQLDAWVTDGLLGAAELNAADYQIAPNIALLLHFEDLAPFIESRPVAQLARRLVPGDMGRVRAVLPPAWLVGLNRATRPDPSRAQAGSSGRANRRRTGGSDANWTTPLPHESSPPLEYQR